ncbi:hypothetical protein SGPA1_51022 [Streptomyces misionensis JCM 4497]
MASRTYVPVPGPVPCPGTYARVKGEAESRHGRQGPGPFLHHDQTAAAGRADGGPGLPLADQTAGPPLAADRPGGAARAGAVLAGRRPRLPDAAVRLPARPDLRPPAAGDRGPPTRRTAARPQGPLAGRRLRRAADPQAAALREARRDRVRGRRSGRGPAVPRRSEGRPPALVHQHLGRGRQVRRLRPVTGPVPVTHRKPV